MIKNKKRKIKLPLWLKVFLVVLGLYALGIVLLILTENVVLFPTVVMLGSFMIPITYVAFFYERRFIAKVKLLSIITSFLYGGLLGVFVASLFEPIFIRRLDLLTAFVVGFIEEFAKIFGLYLIMRRKRHTSQLNGIIIGAAVGMGFAAFESTGYAFATFLDSGGSLTDTVFVTLLRGILSPLGHGTWTAILAGVLFKESSPMKFNITKNVGISYAAVAVLHGLWDGLPSVFVNYILPGIDFIIAEVLVALIGVIILFKSWREAKARELALSSSGLFNKSKS
jgi:RsiW-degrading membrane proteinase PrsW (M82 family)